MLFFGDLVMREVAKQVLNFDTGICTQEQERRRIRQQTNKEIERIRRESEAEIERMEALHEARMKMIDIINDANVDFEIRKWVCNIYPEVKNDYRMLLIVDRVYQGWTLSMLKSLMD